MESELPTTDAEIRTMIAQGTHVPLAAVSYVNWHNPYLTLVDDLKRAFRSDGWFGLREQTMAVADDVVRTALDKDGQERNPTPNERLATAVRVVAIPDTTRNGFVRGAIAELHLEADLRASGETVLSCADVESITGVDARGQESRGWDVTVRADGGLKHYQVKATTSRPRPGDVKDADVLVWAGATDIHKREVIAE